MVVADHRTGRLESYGPLVAAAASRMTADLDELLREHGVEDVSVAVGRLHRPGGPEHPEDP